MASENNQLQSANDGNHLQQVTFASRPNPTVPARLGGRSLAQALQAANDRAAAALSIRQHQANVTNTVANTIDYDAQGRPPGLVACGPASASASPVSSVNTNYSELEDSFQMFKIASASDHSPVSDKARAKQPDLGTILELPHYDHERLEPLSPIKAFQGGYPNYALGVYHKNQAELLSFPATQRPGRGPASFTTPSVPSVKGSAALHPGSEMSPGYVTKDSGLGARYVHPAWQGNVNIEPDWQGNIEMTYGAKPTHLHSTHEEHATNPYTPRVSATVNMPVTGRGLGCYTQTNSPASQPLLPPRFNLSWSGYGNIGSNNFGIDGRKDSGPGSRGMLRAPPGLGISPAHLSQSWRRPETPLAPFRDTPAQGSAPYYSNNTNDHRPIPNLAFPSSSSVKPGRSSNVDHLSRPMGGLERAPKLQDITNLQRRPVADMKKSGPKEYTPMDSVKSKNIGRRVPTRAEAIQRQIHGFSDGYNGNVFKESNRPADIPDHENCSLWLTGLPPALTVSELLSNVRDAGKVFATHLNEPEPHKGHMTCAAKIIFMDRPSAERLYDQTFQQGGFFVAQYPHHPPARVMWNRIKSAAQPAHIAARKSRVLMVVGPPAQVNEAELLRWFPSKFDYQLEASRTLSHNDDTAVVEFRFGSYRCQAQSARDALSTERAHLGVRCWFGFDTCDRYENLPDDVLAELGVTRKVSAPVQ